MNLWTPLRVTVVAATLLVAACSKPPLSEERVRDYWEAVQVADWATAWEMERRAQTKEENPFQYYDRMRRQQRIVSFEFSQPTVEDDTAVLEIRQLVALPFANGRYTTNVQLEDQWVFADGEWWHLQTTRPQAPADSDKPPAGGDGPPTPSAGDDRTPPVPSPAADEPAAGSAGD